jgi:hypothetical protein
MGLRHPEVVDIMLRDPIDGTPELLMLDSGEVRDEQERHELFLNKLIAYAAFVDDGSFREQFPEATAEEVRVRVVCSRPPNGSMEGVQSVVLRKHDGVRIPVVFELEKDMRARVQRAAQGAAAKTGRRPWWQFWS